MTQNSNQFNITPEKGMLTLLPNTNVANCKVDVNETATLVPGDPVVLKDVSGTIIIVEKAAALTDDVFGFVAKSIKQTEYVAEDMVQIAFADCCMKMEASAAIARGANVQIDPSTSKVATKAATNTVVGKALEKAAADEDLINVLILTPARIGLGT